MLLPRSQQTPGQTRAFGDSSQDLYCSLSGQKLDAVQDRTALIARNGFTSPAFVFMCGFAYDFRASGGRRSNHVEAVNVT
jgi:hypothetical protein